jgi:hypothetical protein
MTMQYWERYIVAFARFNALEPNRMAFPLSRWRLWLVVLAEDMISDAATLTSWQTPAASVPLMLARKKHGSPQPTRCRNAATLFA